MFFPRRLERYEVLIDLRSWYESDVPWDALDDDGEEDLEEFEGGIGAA